MKAQKRNIVGVVIGACLVGNNTEDLELYTESSSIVWKIGYKCSVGWLDGTLLDIKLFNELMPIKSNLLFDKKHVINAMKRALRVYKPDEHIGWNKYDEEMALSDSLAAIIQPKGQGKKAMDYSHLLFDEA